MGIGRRDALWMTALCLVLALTLLPYYAYTAVMLLVKEEWGMTSAEAGWVFGATQAGYVAAILLLMPLTDRVRTPYVLLGSTALSVAGNALFALTADGASSGALLRALGGAGLAGTYMPGLRLLSERFPGHRRGGPAGLYVAAFVTGGALSFGGSGALLPYLGWRPTYLAVSLAGLLAVALAALLVRAERSSPGPSVSASPRPPVPLATVFRSKPVLLMTAGYTAHVWELYGQRSWMAPFLASILVATGADLTAATAQAAFLFSAMHLLGIPTTALAGSVSDRWGRTLTAGAILTLSSLCSLAVGWLVNAPFGLLLAFCFFYALWINPDSPIYLTGVTEAAPRERLGAAMAFQSMAGWSTGIVAPVVFGLILDLVPGPAAWGLGFAALGLGALLGVAAMVALRRSSESLLMAGGRR